MRSTDVTAEDAQFKLRAYCHLDRIQPQFAAFVGKIASGTPPIEGESTLYVEMVPGIWVYRILDRVLKAVAVHPSAQLVEREFGMLAVHAFSQANVLRAGEVVLEALNLAIDDRLAPRIVSEHIITNIHPSQAQVLNRDNGGTMIEGGQTLLVMECEPAAYINLAANEAEKAAQVSLNHLSSVGVFGRLWMSGSESEIMAARNAAVAAMASLTGRPSL
ncbi:MAG: hypothetical protein GX454_05545 [Brooklawnia sp.]|nr:hypothetical protein [Brooklawnia sp.]